VSDETVLALPSAVRKQSDANDAFVQWVRKLATDHRIRLVRYARQAGLDGDDALDCVQEAFIGFMKLPQARGVVGSQADSLKLLSVVLRHLVLNRRRLCRSRAQKLAFFELDMAASDEVTAELLLVRAQEMQRLNLCAQRLPEVQKTILNLTVLQGASGRDVAEALQLSPGHVRVLLHRARDSLRACTCAD
jgi:RNA polymerase sigma factor (sigma-70 family)